MRKNKNSHHQTLLL